MDDKEYMSCGLVRSVGMPGRADCKESVMDRGTCLVIV